MLEHDSMKSNIVTCECYQWHRSATINDEKANKIYFFLFSAVSRKWSCPFFCSYFITKKIAKLSTYEGSISYNNCFDKNGYVWSVCDGNERVATLEWSQCKTQFNVWSKKKVNKWCCMSLCLLSLFLYYSTKANVTIGVNLK